MNRFRQFMYGRYGVDNLSRFLIYTSLIVTLAGTLLRINILVSIAYLPLIYSLYRTFSKNINKRSEENYKFLNFRSVYQRKFGQIIGQFKGSKTHRFYKCPKCRQTIRVPKGKGKICITCPKCKTEFIKRT